MITNPALHPLHLVELTRSSGLQDKRDLTYQDYRTSFDFAQDEVGRVADPLAVGFGKPHQPEAPTLTRRSDMATLTSLYMR